ncbi:MAG TPA: Gfo/Idh/MocA family oxidoreductase, partial [Blastocatellia bacterium]|nr:Gfo/Idh/MocA family oxidoreductase [Blastocatellia bacterium]
RMQRLRWGLIGCGDISRKRVAPALKALDNCELLAVSRARTELAEEFAREFGAERWYSVWRELLNDREIDAVYIATPVYQHAEQTIAAAEAGKHVLCEKPMAKNVAECDRMIDACRANNVRLGIAYYRHFYPVIARIKELIAAGEIGQVVLAQINAFERFNPTPDNPRYWLVKKELSGGGPMMDFGCHRIEVLMNILGPIEKVHGFTAKILFEREVEDTSTALFRFASGSRGMLTVTHAAIESQDTLDIFGSHGSLHVQSLNQGSLRIKSASGEREESLPPHPNFHLPQIEEFTQAVLNHREPKVNGSIGREVALIEEAIYSGPEW